jgi:valine dehydrogenase (NAD+)
MDPAFRLPGEHEQVVMGADPASGLRCIIAIHSTTLGPALGGTRFFPYTSDADALTDALRLSRAMTYKAACAGLDFGGGKAVIVGDPATDKSEALLRSYGRMVESLGGRYVTACDVGTTPADLSMAGRETRWATGGLPAEGGSGDSGIPTAYGVYVGIRALAERVWGSEELRGRHVALQGVGKVGRRLAELLARDGARLSVSDVDQEATRWCAEHLQAEVVSADKIHAVDADVFSPNALGATLNDATIPELTARVVAGAANNQLAEPRHGEALRDRGVLYAPDYVINAGGLIQVTNELHPRGFDDTRVRAAVERIGPRLMALLDLADREGISTAVAAERMAERRIAEVGRLRDFWLPTGR